MRKPSPQLLDLLTAAPPGVAHLALAVRELVLTEAPEVQELVYSVYAVVRRLHIHRTPRRCFLPHCCLLSSRELGLQSGRGIARPASSTEGDGEEDPSYPVRFFGRLRARIFADLHSRGYRARPDSAHKRPAKQEVMQQRRAARLRLKPRQQRSTSELRCRLLGCLCCRACRTFNGSVEPDSRQEGLSDELAARGHGPNSPRTHHAPTTLR
jgi:hypothetical protein